MPNFIDYLEEDKKQQKGIADSLREPSGVPSDKEVNSLSLLDKYLSNPDNVQGFFNSKVNDKIKQYTGVSLYRTVIPHLKAEWSGSTSPLEFKESDSPDAKAWKTIANTLIKNDGVVPSPDYWAEVFNRTMTKQFADLVAGEDVVNLQKDFSVTDKGILFEGQKLNLDEDSYNVFTKFMKRTTGQDKDRGFLDKMVMTAAAFAMDAPLMALTGGIAGETVGAIDAVEALATSSSALQRILGQAVIQSANFNIMGLPQTIELTKKDGVSGLAESVFHNVEMGSLGAITAGAGSKLASVPIVNKMLNDNTALREEAGAIIGSVTFGYGIEKMAGASNEDALATALVFGASHVASGKAYGRVMREMRAKKISVRFEDATPEEAKKENGLAYMPSYYYEKDGKYYAIDINDFYKDGKISPIVNKAPIEKTPENSKQFVNIFEKESPIKENFTQRLKTIRAGKDADRLMRMWEKELLEDYFKENQVGLSALAAHIATATRMVKWTDGFKRYKFPSNEKLDGLMFKYTNKYKITYPELKKYLISNIDRFNEDPENFFKQLGFEESKGSDNEVFTDLKDIMTEFNDAQQKQFASEVDAQKAKAIFKYTADNKEKYIISRFKADGIDVENNDYKSNLVKYNQYSKEYDEMSRGVKPPEPKEPIAKEPSTEPKEGEIISEPSAEEPVAKSTKEDEEVFALHSSAWLKGNRKESIQALKGMSDFEEIDLESAFERAIGGYERIHTPDTLKVALKNGSKNFNNKTKSEILKRVAKRIEGGESNIGKAFAEELMAVAKSKGIDTGLSGFAKNMEKHVEKSRAKDSSIDLADVQNRTKYLIQKPFSNKEYTKEEIEGIIEARKLLSRNNRGGMTHVEFAKKIGFPKELMWLPELADRNGVTLSFSNTWAGYHGKYTNWGEGKEKDLTMNFKRRHDFVGTLVHEYIHFFLDKTSEQNKKARDKIVSLNKELMRQFNKAINEDLRKSSISSAEKESLKFYKRVMNKEYDPNIGGYEELFTHGLTDYGFRKYLQSIKWEGEDSTFEAPKSLWDKISEVMQKLLGRVKLEDGKSLYDKMVESLGEISNEEHVTENIDKAKLFEPKAISKIDGKYAVITDKGNVYHLDDLKGKLPDELIKNIDEVSPKAIPLEDYKLSVDENGKPDLIKKGNVEIDKNAPQRTQMDGESKTKNEAILTIPNGKNTVKTIYGENLARKYEETESPIVLRSKAPPEERNEKPVEPDVITGYSDLQTELEGKELEHLIDNNMVDLKEYSDIYNSFKEGTVKNAKGKIANYMELNVPPIFKAAMSKRFNDYVYQHGEKSIRSIAYEMNRILKSKDGWGSGHPFRKLMGLTTFGDKKVISEKGKHFLNAIEAYEFGRYTNRITKDLTWEEFGKWAGFDNEQMEVLYRIEQTRKESLAIEKEMMVKNLVKYDNDILKNAPAKLIKRVMRAGLDRDEFNKLINKDLEQKEKIARQIVDEQYKEFEDKFHYNGIRPVTKKSIIVRAEKNVATDSRYNGLKTAKYYTYYNDRKEYEAGVRKLKKLGYEVKEVIDVGREIKAGTYYGKLNAFQLMELAEAGDIDFSNEIFQKLLDATKRGYSRHTINKEYIPGMKYTAEELERGTETLVKEAVSGHLKSYYYRQIEENLAKWRQEIEPILHSGKHTDTAIKAKNEYEYAQRYYNQLKQKESTWVDGVRGSAMAFQVGGLKPAFLVLQASQPLQTTLSNLVAEFKQNGGSVGDAIKSFNKAAGDAVKAIFEIRAIEKGEKTRNNNLDAELIKHLQDLELMKKLSPVGISELTSDVGEVDYFYQEGIGKHYNSFKKAMLILGKGVEKYTRVHAAISHYEAGKLKGLEGKELLNYMADGIDKSMNEWGKGGRAPIFDSKKAQPNNSPLVNGLKKSFMTYKTFGFYNYGMYRQFIAKRQYAALMTKFITGMGMHGLRTFPLAASLMFIANLFTDEDMDYKLWQLADEIDKTTKTPIGSVSYRGLGSLIGANTSDMFDESIPLAPELWAKSWATTWESKMLEIGLGAPLGFTEGLVKGGQQFSEDIWKQIVDRSAPVTKRDKERAWRIYKNISPVFLRNMINAFEYEKDGIKYDGKIMQFADDLTPMDIVLKFLSFPIEKQTEARLEFKNGIEAEYRKANQILRKAKEYRNDLREEGLSPDDIKREMERIMPTVKKARETVNKLKREIKQLERRRKNVIRER